MWVDVVWTGSVSVGVGVSVGAVVVVGVSTDPAVDEARVGDGGDDDVTSGAGLERPGALGGRTDRAGGAVHRRKSFQVRDSSRACSRPGVDERAVERGPWLVTDPGFGREPAGSWMRCLPT